MWKMHSHLPTHYLLYTILWRVQEYACQVWIFFCNLLLIFMPRVQYFNWSSVLTWPDEKNLRTPNLRQWYCFRMINWNMQYFSKTLSSRYLFTSLVHYYTRYHCTSIIALNKWDLLNYNDEPIIFYNDDYDVMQFSLIFIIIISY